MLLKSKRGETVTYWPLTGEQGWLGYTMFGVLNLIPIPFTGDEVPVGEYTVQWGNRALVSWTGEAFICLAWHTMGTTCACKKGNFEVLPLPFKELWVMRTKEVEKEQHTELIQIFEITNQVGRTSDIAVFSSCSETSTMIMIRGIQLANMRVFLKFNRI